VSQSGRREDTVSTTARSFSHEKDPPKPRPRAHNRTARLALVRWAARGPATVVVRHPRALPPEAYDVNSYDVQVRVVDALYEGNIAVADLRTGLQSSTRWNKVANLCWPSMTPSSRKLKSAGPMPRNIFE